MKLLSAEVSGSTPNESEHFAQAHLFFGFEHESYLMSSRAEIGELPVRSKSAASMDLVDRIGHLSSALS